MAEDCNKVQFNKQNDKSNSKPNALEGKLETKSNKSEAGFKFKRTEDISTLSESVTKSSRNSVNDSPKLRLQ